MQITRTCDRCGTPYTRTARRIGKYCSPACGNASRRQPSTVGRRMLNRPNHPLAGSSGLIPEYRVVLYDHIGAGPHPCHWCGQLIDWMPGAGCSKGALVVDHVDYDWRNNDISNLVPACQGCNGSRSRRISDDEPHIVRPNGERVRGEWRSCEFCEVRFVAYRNKDKRRGRFCSMSCARKFDHRKRKAS